MIETERANVHVGSGPNCSRTIDLVCAMPFTTYENVPVPSFANVNFPLPTARPGTGFDENSVESNGRPLV